MFGAAQAALGQDVTLKSADGSVGLSGKLLDYDGEFYRIETIFGEMTLRALGVTCTGHACPDPGQYAADITIAGDRDALNDLLPPLIEAYGFATGQPTLRRDQVPDGWTYFVASPSQVPVARIQAQPGDSATGLAELAHRETDLVVTSRPAASGEIRAARIGGIGDLASPFRHQVLAIDALVFIVSPENPVRSLALDDIAQIYAGTIRNWSEVGGIDAPIVLLQREAGSDANRAFRRNVFPGDVPLSPVAAREFGSDKALSDAVTADPFAIGFTGFSGIRNAVPLAIRGTCGIRQRPSRFGLQSGDYPFARQKYLYTTQRRLPIFARDLLRFLASRRGQDAVTAAGFVSTAISTQSFGDQPDRVSNAVREAGDVSLAALQGFVRIFSDAARLSPTFRFDGNLIRIDQRSERNIATLARMIELGDFDGRELVFAGFSDSQGSATGNRRVSRQRAERVADAVRAAAARADLSKVRITVHGLGEVSPLACNDTESGRWANRRVEVWVR